MADGVLKLEKVPNRKNYWYCQCTKCGSIKEVYISNIKVMKSCGCYRGEKIGVTNHNWSGVGDLSASFFGRFRVGAKTRGLKFSIDIKYAWELFESQNRKCAITGWDIYFAKTKKGYEHGEATASLDRIDSSIGYEPGNLRWVHKSVNILKKDMPDKEFFKICMAVAKNANG